MSRRLEWSAERDAALHKMWAARMTGRVIAERLRIAKTAVFRRMRQLELSRRRQSPIRPATLPKSPISSMAPSRPVFDERNTNAIPAGHPLTWGLITAGTLLDGAPYRVGGA